MKFNGFVGPSYTLPSVSVDCQRCVNLYPELVESGTGKEGQQYYLRSTPGLDKIFEIGSGPIRLIHYDNTVSKNEGVGIVRVFVVSGNTVYKILSIDGGATWFTTTIGTMTTSSGTVTAAGAQIDAGVVIFVDGTTNYVYHRFLLDGLYVEFFQTFDDAGLVGVPTASHVVWVDGYFIFNSVGTSQFYVSDWSSLNVDPLSFASAEADPDNITAILVNNRNVIFFNEESTEIWADAGNADFPFERISGGFIEKGIAAPFSAAKIDGMVFWLGRDYSGQGIVYASNSLLPQRISTHAMESTIANYASIKDATGFTYQSNGHVFYVLNFAEGTWVYDYSTKLWHERAYLNAGALERHRGDHHAFIPDISQHWVGDYANGKIYNLTDAKKTDEDAVICRKRVFPHASTGLKWGFHNSLQIDMKVGIGLDGGVQGSNPQAVLTWSDDGGRTWSNESMAALGAGVIGEFKKRVLYRRLGKSRDRVYDFTITDPVDVVLMNAEIDVVQGAS